MSNDIQLQGVPANAPPGVYVQLDFAQGATGAPTQVVRSVILANALSGSVAQSATPGTVYGPDTLTTLQTTQDIINLAGAGSPAHLAFAAFKAINKTTPLYFAPVALATGTAASQTITITTTAGQTIGVVQYSVDGKTPAQAVYGSTDTGTTIATNLALAVNGNVNLPVQASSAGNVVTITAKTVGARGNWLRGFAQVVSGSGVSVSVTQPTFFTGGAGSDATGYTNTLNGLAATLQRYYYYIPEAGFDSVDGYANGIVAEIQSQIDTLATASIGLRQRAVFGSVDTLAHTAAVSTSVNDARLEVVNLKNLDLLPVEIAASAVAAYTTFEGSVLNAGSVNYDNFGSDAQSQPFWQIKAPLDGSASSATDIQTAVDSGVTILKVTPGKNTAIVKRCTSRYYSLGGVGGSQQVLDLRITDAGKVTVCDRFFDDLSALISQRYPRMLIGDDTESGSPPAGPGVVTVSKLTDTCLEVVQTYAAAGLINGPATASGLVVQRNVNPSSSFGIVVPLYVSDPAHTFLIHGLQNPAIVI
jgi:phage tail sheath gpL-like